MNNRAMLMGLGALGIVAAFLFGVIVTHSVDDTSTPLISGLLSIVSLFVIQSVQQNKTDRKIDGINQKADDMLNGVMDEKIKRNVHEVLNERDKDPDPV
jgi:uncharacterized protein YacL